MEIIPEILIIASQQNAHVQLMKQYLQQKYPQKIYFIWDLALVPTQTFCSILLNQQKLHIAISFYQDNNTIILDHLRTIWWLEPHSPRLDSSIQDADHIQFAYTECCQLIEGLWHLLDCLWINHPEKQEIALNPICQLHAAKQAGFLIPETLITSYPIVVSEFWEKHQQQIMYRQLVPFSPEQEEIQENDFNQLESLKLAPLIFQETVRYKAFLNVIVIGDFVMFSQLYQNNNNQLVSKRCDEITIPKDITNKIKKLVHLLDLVYVRIEMGIDSQGKYVFFSLDPFGSFVELEEQTGVHLTEVLGELLVHGLDTTNPEF